MSESANHESTDIKYCPYAMTVPEVAKVLRICEKTVYKLIQSGEIPVKRVGKKMIVPKKMLYAYLNDTAV